MKETDVPSSSELGAELLVDGLLGLEGDPLHAGEILQRRPDGTFLPLGGPFALACRVHVTVGAQRDGDLFLPP